MIKFDIPVNLNGAELKEELKAVGIEFINETYALLIENNSLFVNIAPEFEAIAAPIIAAHNGTTVPPEPTPADKLAAAGLTVDELKAVLGIN
jgi:hypothetical protein